MPALTPSGQRQLMAWSPTIGKDLSMLVYSSTSRLTYLCVRYTRRFCILRQFLWNSLTSIMVLKNWKDLPSRENLAPKPIKHLSIRSIVAAKTGYASSSSFPMACHWAPWPVKTKPIRGLVVDLNGVTADAARLVMSSADDLAETAILNGKWVRRWPSV